MQHITHYLLNRPIDADPYFDRVETYYDSHGIVALHFHVAGNFYELDMRTPAMKDYVDQRWHDLSESMASDFSSIDLAQELNNQSAPEHLAALGDETRVGNIVNMVIDRAYCTLPRFVCHEARKECLRSYNELNNFCTSDLPGKPVYVYLGDFRTTCEGDEGFLLEQEFGGTWWTLHNADEVPFSDLQKLLGEEVPLKQLYLSVKLARYQTECYSN